MYCFAPDDNGPDETGILLPPQMVWVSASPTLSYMGDPVRYSGACTPARRAAPAIRCILSARRDQNAATGPLPAGYIWLTPDGAAAAADGLEVTVSVESAASMVVQSTIPTSNVGPTPVVTSGRVTARAGVLRV